MADSIEHPRPILLGVSFGGMVAIEIAKQVPIERLIIVSSVKTTAELPPWMRLTGRLYLYKVLPTRSYKFTEKFDNRRLGVTNDDERKLVDSYRKKIDPVYFNWAVHRIFRWKNDWFPENIVQIHGERDRIFPLKRLTPTHVITGGTHIMILNKADKLSRCINSVI